MPVRCKNYYEITNGDYLTFPSSIDNYKERLLAVLNCETNEELANHIASLFYLIFKHLFLSILNDNKQTVWYVYHDNRWGFISDSEMFEFVEHNLTEFCKNHIQSLKAEIAMTMNGVDVYSNLLEVNTKLEKLKTIYEKSTNRNFIHNILRECAVYFHNKDFSTMKNMKPCICFTNGVLDLTTGRFRDGKYDDYSTLSTNFAYEQNVNSSNNVKLNKFLEEIFPNEKTRDNFLTQICYAIFEMNLKSKPLERIADEDGIKRPVFLVGTENNGINTVLNFIRNCFPDYFENIPSIKSKEDAERENYGRKVHESFNYRKFLILEDCNNLEKAFETIGSLVGYEKKVFIVIRKHLLDDCPFQEHLKFFHRIDFESTFVSESETKYSVPGDRESQLLNKTFHCNPDISRELNELKSSFLTLLLQHREKIMK